MTTNALIGHAIDKNPVEFADAFKDIIMQKAAEAIDAKRVELAQSVYGSEADNSSEDQTVPTDNDDDLDIDLDDLDLEDIADDENN